MSAPMDAETEPKATDPKTDPDYRSGLISGIGLSVEWIDYVPDEGPPPEPNTSWCYALVTASIDGSPDDVVLHRDLLGIFQGDERPTVSAWTSAGGGVASGKRDDRFDA